MNYQKKFIEMNRVLILIFSLIILITSCSQKTTNSSSAQITDACKWNDSKEFALCTSEIGDGNNQQTLNFKILDKDNKVVKEGTTNGNVKWLNNNVVEIVRLSDNDNLSEVYVITTGETMTKKDYLNKGKYQVEVGDIEYIKQDLDPDACLIEAKVISMEGSSAVIEITTVKVCRTVTSEPKVGQSYSIDVSGQDLTVGNNYTLEVSVPAESKGNRLFLLKIKE
jgi:hypothetical protein